MDYYLRSSGRGVKACFLFFRLGRAGCQPWFLTNQTLRCCHKIENEPTFQMAVTGEGNVGDRQWSGHSVTNQIECMLSPTTNVIVFPDIDDSVGALSVTINLFCSAF